MEEGLGQIRGALLEADVHLRVATDLVDRVRAKALGTQVLKSVDAGQMIVKIFHDELVAMLSADGETEIRRVYHIDRGYERIDDRLRALGGAVRREAQPPVEAAPLDW